MPAARRRTRTKRNASTTKRGPKPGTYFTPPLLRLEIRKQFETGTSIRQLAIDHNKDEATISRIVKGPEAQEEQAATRDMITAYLMAEVYKRVGPRLAYEVDNLDSQMGASMAFQLADRIGAIPPKLTTSQSQNTNVNVELVKEDPPDERIRKQLMALERISLETKLMYGRSYRKWKRNPDQ